MTGRAPAWRWFVLSRLLAYLRPYLGWMALSVAAGAATIGSGIALLGTSAFLIASAALQPPVGYLQVAIVGVRFFGISRAVLRYLERLVSHSVNFRHLAALRVWFYRRIEPLAPAVLQEYHSADLLNRAMGDIETLENFYVRAVAPPLSAIIVTGAVTWFLKGYDPRLAAVLAAALACGGIILPWIAYRMGRAPGVLLSRERARLETHLLDAVQGMPDLLVFGQAGRQLSTIRQAGVTINQANQRQAVSGAAVNAAAQLLSGFALLAVMLVAIPLVGIQLDGVALAVIMLVTLASFEAITPLIPAGQHLENSLQSARRLFDLVETKPEVIPPAQPLPAPGSANLSIRGLCFGYRGDPKLILERFDLELPFGKHTTLLGPSGAGKTTLANLLLRFWEFREGSIVLDGRDIRRYEPEDVRGLFSVISQPAYLFSATLRENLLVARPGASTADLERAVEDAQLTELVSQLPGGFDTWLGDRGLQLSGGERQRVLIARALLRDSPIWILDEPTANLDAITEQHIIETLLRTGRGRSLIYITHRLVGLEAMDEILVLQNGLVEQRGSHDQLIQQPGLYSRWWEIHRQGI